MHDLEKIKKEEKKIFSKSCMLLENEKQVFLVL